MTGRVPQPSPDLRTGYELMAQDGASERQAFEWADALIGDPVSIGLPTKDARTLPPGGRSRG
jgi:hypothetical protein